MNKLVVAAAALLILVAGLAVAQEVGERLAVSVQDGELRSTPGFLSAVTAVLGYGETVEVLELRPGWARVRVESTGADGWLHATAVAQPQALRLEASGNAAATTSTREIALAGRGFNEQIETQYSADTGLDFSVVDQMERYGQPVEKIAAFFADGGLAIAGGAQ